MNHESDEISAYLVDEANRSKLPPADRARALALAGQRLKTAESDDAVERLAEELVELARRHAPTTRSEVRAFLGEVGTGLDIAAIEMEGVVHNDTRLTNKASTRLDSLPLNTTLGCDEVFTGLMERLHPLIDRKNIDPVAKDRVSKIMKSIIMGEM